MLWMLELCRQDDFRESTPAESKSSNGAVSAHRLCAFPGEKSLPEALAKGKVSTEVEKQYDSLKMREREKKKER